MTDAERYHPSEDLADYVVMQRLARIAERFPDDADVHWLLHAADAAWIMGDGAGDDNDLCWGRDGTCPTICDGGKSPHNQLCMLLRRLFLPSPKVPTGKKVRKGRVR